MIFNYNFQSVCFYCQSLVSLKTYPELAFLGAGKKEPEFLGKKEPEFLKYKEQVLKWGELKNCNGKQVGTYILENIGSFWNVLDY